MRGEHGKPRCPLAAPGMHAPQRSDAYARRLLSQGAISRHGNCQASSIARRQRSANDHAMYISGRRQVTGREPGPPSCPRYRPILVRSGESKSSSLLHGHDDRLRSVCSAVSSRLASQSSGCPRQRGQSACSGQSLRGGCPRGSHGGLLPDRNARNARHSNRTSSWLTLDMGRPSHQSPVQGLSAATAILASPFARKQVWRPLKRKVKATIAGSCADAARHSRGRTISLPTTPSNPRGLEPPVMSVTAAR